MTTQNMLRGRQVVASLTNQSGGAIIAGDVVIISAANDESFTTTTSAAYNSTRVCVALESIAAAAAGRVLLEGYAPLVNVSASATRGHYLLTHTVAKQATSQAGYAAGVFGQIIKAGTTPSAMIFPVAQVGSAGVGGSSGSTDNAVIRADGTGGATVQSSLATVDDSGTVNIPTGQTYNINNSPHTHAGGGYDYICLVDQKTQNTSGGTFTQDAWQTRDINTERADPGNHASIAANQFTLGAGTYVIHASAPAINVQTHMAKLYNVTDAADVLFGTAEVTQPNGNYDSNRSIIVGTFTIATSKTFEIRHYCKLTVATFGFGALTNYGPETYTIVELWKIG